MSTYIVSDDRHIMHDGKSYGSGDEIQLLDDEAAQLLSVGAVRMQEPAEEPAEVPAKSKRDRATE